MIDTDSFIQLNNKILVEYFDGLERYRRQRDKLSNPKFEKVIHAYTEYHRKEHIAEDILRIWRKAKLKN